MQTMSLEDLNSFHNGHDSELTNYAKPGEEMDNIFEEIEELLKRNEGLEVQVKGVTTPPVNIPPTNNLPNSNTDTEAVNLDFLPACDNQAFLISADTQTLPEEELSLYSVNQNELQPVNAPFMVPGIYKKIANAPLTASDGPEKSVAAEASNVFFTTKRAKGKIISRNQFENCSTAEELNEACEDNDQENYIEEASLDGAESLPSSDVLLNFASSILKSASSDQLEIDRNKNEITRTQAISTRRVVYRLLGPEDMDLEGNECATKLATTISTPRPGKLKKGRPRKQPKETPNAEIPPTLSKKSKIEQTQKVADTAEPTNTFQQPLIRTRSGRVVKLVKPQTHTPTIDEMPPLESEPTKDLIEDAKDKDFTIPIKEDNPCTSPNTNEIVNKRRVPPEAICPKCGKIFLGRRLKRHFTQHPDHMLAHQDIQQQQQQQQAPAQEPQQQDLVGIENLNEEMSLFRFLISKLKNPLLNEDQRTDIFLNELNDLIEQLQLRSTRLIRNTSGLHFVSTRTARVLGIPEGQYALDMSAIEMDTPFMDSVHEQAYNGEEQKRPRRLIAASVNTPSIDYTAISLDDTLTDEAAQKLNLSAGGKLLPPSEESLLRGVDDLVHDGITKLVDANLLQPPRAAVQSSHYDHVNDNAVEALTIKENNTTQDQTPLLGLSVDFFQFKNN